MIQRFIDDALLLSAKEIRIVHGKGDGILRSIIRDYLKTVGEIEHFGNEHVERGGDGVTVINFK
jgi:DNA mismatch repair protein MutS2